MSQTDFNTALCNYQDAFDEYKEPIWRIDTNTKQIKMEDMKYNYSNTCEQPIVFPYCGNNRRRFGYIDDNFLLLALKALGSSKEFE